MLFEHIYRWYHQYCSAMYEALYSCGGSTAIESNLEYYDQRSYLMPAFAKVLALQMGSKRSTTLDTCLWSFNLVRNTKACPNFVGHFIDEQNIT